MTAVHVAALRREDDSYYRAMAAVLCDPVAAYRGEAARVGGRRVP
jgi:hypothetical protein